MHWKVGRVNCTFKVRVRRGWADLRDFLTQVGGRAGGRVGEGARLWVDR